MNIATRGPAFQKELEAKRAESRRMLMAFIRVSALIYHMGGEISFEWPRHASGWSLPEMVALIEPFGFIDALCDSCAFGLVSKDNQSRLKPIDVLLFETGVNEVKVQGLVHRLLDRKEWIGQASAIECVRGEKDGLVNAGTWIESQIQSKADVLAWSRRTSNPIHFG